MKVLKFIKEYFLLIILVLLVATLPSFCFTQYEKNYTKTKIGTVISINNELHAYTTNLKVSILYDDGEYAVYSMNPMFEWTKTRFKEYDLLDSLMENERVEITYSNVNVDFLIYKFKNRNENIITNVKKLGIVSR